MGVSYGTVFDAVYIFARSYKAVAAGKSNHSLLNTMLLCKVLSVEQFFWMHLKALSWMCCATGIWLPGGIAL